MLTLLALLAVQAVFAILGLGVTSRFGWLRRNGWSPLLAPVAGHLALAMLSLRLCTSGATGRQAVLVSASVLAALTLISWRRSGEALLAMARLRERWWVLGASGAAQVVLAAAPIQVGIDTYNGFGNLDAWYYVMDTSLLKDLPYFAEVAPQPLRVHLHTIATATRVGAQFSVLLVSLTGLDAVVAFNLVLASFLFLLPVTLAFICQAVMRLDMGWTLLGVLLACAHSSLQLAFCNQHLGHLLSLAVTPLALAVLCLALRDDDGGLAVLAVFLGAGGLYAYWPTLPLLLVPAAVLALSAAWARRDTMRIAGVYGVGLILLALAVSPRVLADDLTAVVGAQRSVPRNDPVMIAFNPYLTEDLLPLAAGLTEPGALGALWLTLGPAQHAQGLRTVLAYLLLASGFLGAVAVGVWAALRARQPLLPVALAVYGILGVLVLRREYGYGLYKLVSWSHALVVLAFLVGVRALWSCRRWPRLTRPPAVLLVLAYLWLNVRTGLGYERLSVLPSAGRLALLAFAKNPDWRGLEAWAERHSDAPIVIGMHFHVAQYWASYRLRHSGYVALVPQDVMGGVSLQDQLHHRGLAEVPDPADPLALQDQGDALARAGYFLDWATRNDVTQNRIEAQPLESNATFRLYRLRDVRRLLSPYDGWYAFQNDDSIPGRRLGFRWMQPRASLLLFRFPRQPFRLSLWLRAGVGADRLERTIRVTHRGRRIAELKVEGSGRLLSDPFTPETDVERVEIEAVEPSSPTPRQFSLWNSWVEQDPRRLAAGVYEVRLLPEAELSSALSVAPGTYPPDVVRASFFYDGLHWDDWLGERFRVGVPAAAGDKLLIRGEIARRAQGDLPFRFGVTVNGERRPGAVCGDDGDCALEVPLPRRSLGPLDWIELTPERSLEVETSHTKGQDVRRISFRLKSLELSRTELEPRPPG